MKYILQIGTQEFVNRMGSDVCVAAIETSLDGFGTRLLSLIVVLITTEVCI